MRVLVTAGNTLVPIDRVRGITNIFTGRTGAQIAVRARQRGHQVVLLTSHPEAIHDLPEEAPPQADGWSVRRYRTFDELREAMAEALRPEAPEAVVHSAAVSDYQSGGIYAPAPHTHFRAGDQCWESSAGSPSLVDMAAGKVKSDAPELWLRLVRAPKLIDLMRNAWGFRGVLVKFKLEVGVSEERLLEVAERSRGHSSADLMVANTLEGAGYWAYLGPLHGQYERVSRKDLAGRLLEAIESLHRERSDG
jgi:phosphopantothenate---cysteine ligase (CTP)